MADPSDHSTVPADEAESNSLLPVIITGSSVLAVFVFWLLDRATDSTGITVAFLLAQVMLISIIIWQACDPFADAAQWIGTTLHLPGSVRGATLDAVASSMPELFTGIFFVMMAGEATVSEGYGSTVATCAGSAVYNMILIPAFCAIFISYHRPERPTIDVEAEVITRDGLWFLGASSVLIVFLFMPSLHWWMAAVLLAMYVIYVAQLFRDARLYQAAMRAIHKHLGDVDKDTELSTEAVRSALKSERIHVSEKLIDRVREQREEDEDEEPDTAGLLFGMVDVHLNHLSAWCIIFTATAVAGTACYWLVEVTKESASTLGVPTFFMAVIVAAAASSVPDTFLSIGAARRGDDDGAVSNAFGSNIFDICICLSLPLFITAHLADYQPVYLTVDGTASGAAMPGLVGLRMLLLVLTMATLLIMWHNLQLTRNKAYVLCLMYAVFIAYAVVGSLEVVFP